MKIDIKSVVLGLALGIGGVFSLMYLFVGPKSEFQFNSGNNNYDQIQ